MSYASRLRVPFVLVFLLFFSIVLALSARAQIVISEIMYNPASSEDNWEWVELYNAGASAVSLSGYVFDDNNGVAHGSANIASGTIPPGETAILYNADVLSDAGGALIGLAAGLALTSVRDSDRAATGIGQYVGVITGFGIIMGVGSGTLIGIKRGSHDRYVYPQLYQAEADAASEESVVAGSGAQRR